MTPDPEPTEEKRGRHARPDDEPIENPAGEPAGDSAAAPSGGATSATATSTEAPPTKAPPGGEPSTDDAPPKAAPPPPASRPPQPAHGTAEDPPRKRSGHSIGLHPAGFPLVLSAALVTGLGLVPLLLDQLNFDVATRAARSARSAAPSWPAGGEPWFWPDFLAGTAGVTAVVVLVLALVGLRVPDVVVLVLAGLLAVTTAPAAWATLDVVNSRLWELLPVSALCVLAFGLAATAAARFRAPQDDGSSGGGGGAAGILVGGWVMVLLLLFAGAAVASSAERNAGRAAGPPQDVPGLLSIRAADAADLRDLRGSWAPQLAAAQVGADDDAGASAFAGRHYGLTARFPALLVRGDDIGASDLDDTWWLTLGRQGFGSEAEVQAWCSGNGLTPPDCTPRQVGD